MKNRTSFGSLLSLTFFCIVVSIAASAQKLPGVQPGSLRAPANIKIDGKATEWNDQYQAYNKATDIFYTLSNDDQNLYLTVRAEDPTVITKIMSGGLSLNIQKSGKKTDKDAMCISYPVFGKNNRTFFTLRRRKGLPALSPEEAVKEGDSLMVVNNKKIATNSKWIAVTGVKELDTLISVYNEDGIKAVGLFDNKKAYVYELSVTLKTLGLSTDQGSMFLYHVLLNGGPNKYNGPTMTITSSISADGTQADRAKLDEIQARMNAITATLYGTTDFWGEYTLAKK